MARKRSSDVRTYRGTFKMSAKEAAGIDELEVETDPRLKDFFKTARRLLKEWTNKSMSQPEPHWVCLLHRTDKLVWRMRLETEPVEKPQPRKRVKKTKPSKRVKKLDLFRVDAPGFNSRSELEDG